MASHVSSRHWFLRDIRPSYVLLVMVAFVVAIFAYFIDWSTVRRESAVPPKNDNIEQRYTGSVIIHTGGDMCWAFILDNRTGNMRDGVTPNAMRPRASLPLKIRLKKYACAKSAKHFAIKGID
jgi:hypothetical protein